MTYIHHVMLTERSGCWIGEYYFTGSACGPGRLGFSFSSPRGGAVRPAQRAVPPLSVIIGRSCVVSNALGFHDAGGMIQW